MVKNLLNTVMEIVNEKHTTNKTLIKLSNLPLEIYFVFLIVDTNRNNKIVYCTNIKNRVENSVRNPPHALSTYPVKK